METQILYKTGRMSWISYLQRKVMSAARFAAYCAVGLSLTSVLCCILFVPMLLDKIGDIHRRLELDMDEFKVLSSDIWGQIVKAKRSVPKGRTARQTYGGGPATYSASNSRPNYASNNNGYGGSTSLGVNSAQSSCTCDANNFCPAGPPGPPGQPGDDGYPGPPGEDGARGLPGISPPINTTPDGRCRVCPPGGRGPPGPPGPLGAPGIKGDPGQNGRAGSPGNPGFGSLQGPPGLPGRNGNDGSPGTPGRPGLRGGKGERGRDGAPGNPGPKGPPGNEGRRGTPGGVGRQGPPGPQGTPGTRGFPGVDGDGGGRGFPGEDAQYCPCPAKTNFSPAAVSDSSYDNGNNNGQPSWQPFAPPRNFPPVGVSGGATYDNNNNNNNDYKPRDAAVGSGGSQTYNNGQTGWQDPFVPAAVSGGPTYDANNAAVSAFNNRPNNNFPSSAYLNQKIKRA